MKHTMDTPAARILAAALMLLIFAYVPDSSADDIEEIKKNVVKIITNSSSDNEELGAGLILSVEHQNIFILTAYHVVRNATNISVQFYGHPAEVFEASLFQPFDEENDLAVLFISTDFVPNNLSPIRLGATSRVDELDQVVAVGHPFGNDWQVSAAEIRSSVSTQFAFASDAVLPGSSGGLLLNAGLQLIGLVTREDGANGIAMKIDDALDIVSEWNVPYAFKRGRKTWPWLVGVGVAGGLAAVLLSGDNSPSDPTGTLVITVVDPVN